MYKRAFFPFLFLICVIILSFFLVHAEEKNNMVRQIIDNMSLHEKICQLFIVEPTDIVRKKYLYSGGKGTKNAIMRYPVSGWIFLPRNIGKEAKLAVLTKKMQEDIVSLGLPAKLFFCSDEEGGDVTRIVRRFSKIPFPSANFLGTEGISAVENAAKNASHVIKKLGFNLNFAPVADLQGAYIKTRSFSGNPKTVSECVVSFLDAMETNHVAGVVKHFPGLGSISSDLHKGKQISHISLDELRKKDFQPFAHSIRHGVKAIMVSHAIYTNIDSTYPASLSPTIVSELLRKELGFDGVVITDALNMKSISNTYSSKEAAILSLKAGCDILLMPANFQNALHGVINAVKSGELSEDRINESLFRILCMKYDLGLLTIQNDTISK